MDIYDLFSKFELELLPKGWVQQTWRDDFSEASEFPPEYEMYLEDANISELMLTASEFIKQWMDTTDLMDHPSTSTSHDRSSLNTSQMNSKSWQNLVTNNVLHKPLISVLSVFILRGKTEKEFEERRLGLIATDLYLLLLAIPGSQVYHIFNQILYSHAIENLKICNLLTNSSVNSKTVKKKKSGRRVEEHSDDEDEQSHPESDIEDQALSHSDKCTIINLLCKVMDDLLFVLKKYQLKGQEDSLIITIQISILLTRLERSSSSLLSKSPPANSLSYVAYKAYKILLALCTHSHGDVQDTVRRIMREMISAFLIFDEKGLKLSAKEATTIKDHSLQFICNLLSSVRDPAFLGVFILVQQLCVRIPDKADLRAKGVQVVVDILNVLPQTLYSSSVIWIMSFCHNDLVKNRITGLEIVTKLLLGHERIPSSPLRPFPQNGTHLQNGHADNDSDEGDDNGIVLTQLPDYSTTKFLLGTILSRCQDPTPSVRAKSLSILANLVSSNNRSVRREMESIFVTPYLHAETIEGANLYEKGFFDYQQFIKGLDKETNANIDPLPGAKAIINLLELFVVDEKVFVRKSAFQVLSNIFLINEKWMNNKHLEILVNNCRDMSVMVRKLLVQCLTDLLMHYPSHQALAKYWVLGVLPLLADQEIKSQEKVLEVLQTVILDNLVAYNQMKTDLHALPWLLLKLIGEHNKRKQFLYACHKWVLNNTLKQSLITTLKTHIDTENNVSVWFLLFCFSEYLDIKDPQFVLDYFYENVFDSQQVGENCCQLVTEVMHLSWRQLPPLTQINLCDSLLKHLSQFTVPLPMISRCIDMCQLITEAHADSAEQARERIKEWAGNIISICESQLEKVIGVNSPVPVEDELRLSQYIYTLGDAALICPAQVKQSSLVLMHNLLMGEPEPNEEEDKLEDRWKGVVSASVQAVTVVTLGKLCLQKEQTANVLVPLLGSLLSDTPHPEIKINVMIALTDMCIKFTSLVEAHLPEMCICLRDKDLQVRENTLNLMIQLIQEDYLKLRCPVLFHLLTMINDEDQEIRDTTKSFIINSLLVKQKNILVQNFVEGLFHYNAYDDLSAYSKGSKMNERERLVFSLEGPEKMVQRRNIYRFMLENMMDDERFRVTHRLCLEVLAGVAEGDIELTSSGTTMLQDTLYVLSCDEIRLSHMRATPKDNEDEDEAAVDMENFEKAVNQVARKALISQVVKRNMVENVVPIFIKLKHKLKQMKSPLVRDLLASLRELMKDYKTEINEILAADEELAAEILHDLKNFGEEGESGDENEEGVPNGDVLKQAVMEVVKLSEARKSLNMSKQGDRSKRSSVSSAVSHCSDKSTKSPNHSVSQPSSNRTSPGNNRMSHALDSQPGPSGVKFSPSSSKSSPVSNSQPHSNKTSPVTQRSSTGSNNLSPGNLSSEAMTDRGPPSPSSISSKSDTSQIVEERRSLPRSSEDRNSTCSSNSSGEKMNSRKKKAVGKKKKR